MLYNYCVNVMNIYISNVVLRAIMSSKNVHGQLALRNGDVLHYSESTQ